MNKFYQENRRNILIGLFIGCGSILFLYFIFNFQFFWDLFKKFIRIISPFIIGYSIAFLAMPTKRFIQNLLCKKLKVGVSRFIAVFLSFIMVLGLFTLSIMIIFPQLISSVIQLSEYIPDAFDRISHMINDLVDEYPIILEYLKNIDLSSLSNLLGQIQALLTSVLPKLLDFSLAVTFGIANVFVALIVALFMLFYKEELDLQVKRINYFLFDKKRADFFLFCSNVTSRKFNSFILGKLIDSLIIGIICFIGMKIFNFPFAVLISFIIGITNMIPIFGPFIGAVPGFLIILIINPIQALWFALFVLVLQQFDANILGPYILQGSVGLPTLWVIFALIVGSGFYGLLGMFIGVPVFASIYEIVGVLMDKKITKEEVAQIKVKKTI